MKKLPFVITLVLLLISNLHARILILEGDLDGVVHLKQQAEFTADRPVNTLIFRFALPANFSNRGVNQDIKTISMKLDPKPDSVEDETDRFGNRFKKVTWKKLKSDASMNIEFEARVRSSLPAMTSEAVFPLTKLSEKETLFLTSTQLVQADLKEISDLAKSLTQGSLTEFQAVNAILNFVSDNIKYSYNPEKYDALHTLTNKSGNCQNFAHLSMALLRASGIPSRIVGGISLKDQWKVPVDSQNSVVQGMGQGGHAWMEIYFPDLGWLSYDPQQSRQFTSTRHIKQTHGLDSTDINDSWSATPYLPKYSELIDARYIDDIVNVKLKGTEINPRPYLVSNSVMQANIAIEPPTSPVSKPVVPIVVLPPTAKVAPTDPPAKIAVPPEKTPSPILVEVPAPVTPVLPPVIEPLPPSTTKPLPQVTKPELKPPPVVIKTDSLKSPDPPHPIEFGNQDFPNLVDTYRVSGMTGTRILDKETSEYVTSSHIYAQAVIFEKDLSLDRISLAMHKFGGDGTLFLDLVSDENGRPSLDGIRSKPVFLDNIDRKAGYYWIDFKFRDEASSNVVKKGKYWIVLRHSGDAIVNWFYIPGKPYSKGDDTRSTAKGYRWEDILNYDFVFKVSGLTNI